MKSLGKIGGGGGRAPGAPPPGSATDSELPTHFFGGMKTGINYELVTKNAGKLVIH